LGYGAVGLDFPKLIEGVGRISRREIEFAVEDYEFVVPEAPAGPRQNVADLVNGAVGCDLPQLEARSGGSSREVQRAIVFDELHRLRTAGAGVDIGNLDDVAVAGDLVELVSASGPGRLKIEFAHERGEEKRI
jgi:hypothetical protein